MFFSKKKEVKAEIYTEELCGKCGEKTKRRFEDGDYVCKPAQSCRNCSSSETIVSAIYGEYPPETEKS